MSPVLPLQARETAATPATRPTPWLYKGSDVPVDTAWLFGELDNGLRYAIRHNGVPPGQVSIRVRVDVGSLMEQDSELGFAHFLEHLTFRGSKYVPDGERSEEHTSELQSLMRISYAVFCLKKKQKIRHQEMR